jgi:hypothetical protein
VLAVPAQRELAGNGEHRCQHSQGEPCGTE